MKKRVLFITEYMQQKEKSGAQNVAKIHYEILSDIVGKENIDVVCLQHYHDSKINTQFYTFDSYNSKFQALLNVLGGNSTLINKNIKDNVLNLIKIYQYEILFLDNRLSGSLIPKIKKDFPFIKVISNFYGISRYQFYESIIQRKDYKKFFMCLGNTIAEKKAAKYSDIVCLMNQREYKRYSQYYGEKKHIFLPCVIKDIYNADDKECLMNNDDFNLLFVGGFFKPNNEGIVWFIKNVLPLIDKKIQLYVVGNHIDDVPKEYGLQHIDNVHFIGRVDNLNPWYQCADAVIAPIFSGDGMKTKIAESLMFGKIILGTDESLIGYENIEHYLCNSVQEFVDGITNLWKAKNSKYYEKNRKRYLEEFSMNAIKMTLFSAISD